MIGNSKIVALCTSRINDGTTQELVEELNRRLVAIGGRLLIYHLCSDYHWVEDYMNADSAIFDLIDYDTVDAVVLMDEKLKNKDVSKEILHKAKMHHIPAITVDCSYENEVSLSFHFEKGFEEVVRHVIEFHQVKDVHFMAGYRDNEFSDQRINVFKKVLAENNIPFTDDMLSYGNFWADPTRAAMQSLLARRKAPEAIICANDIMAINVCAVLSEHGYNVPDDVIVTGYDGIDEIFFLEPHLTSSICDFSELAEHIFALLCDQFAGKEVPLENYIEPRLILGGTCGYENCRSERDSLHVVRRLNTYFFRYQDFDKELFYLSEQMQRSEDLEALTRVVDHKALDHISCVLNMSCLDESKNPSDHLEESSFEDSMLLIRSAGFDQHLPLEMDRKDIYLTMEQLLERKVPIVYNALCSINHLLGFVCFYYDSNDFASYGKIPQIVESLSSGISGFMSLRYQQYLRQELEKTYKYDMLTGLLNRMGFNEELKKLQYEIDTKETPVSVFMSDLDGLKTINDTHGHLVGDKAIKAIADALKFACPDNALLVRLGGDEMFALIPQECSEDEIRAGVKRYLDKFNETSDLPCKVASSIGFYLNPRGEELDFDQLIINADKAMYQKKIERKRNQS